MSSFEGESMLTGYDETFQSTDFIPLNKRESLSIIHIIGICSSMLAYQIAYSVEFALGTPIMSRLKIPQTYQPFIWLTGPLSGFIIQPLIGFYSDAVHLKLGRRRPFIIAGTIGIVTGFIMLYFVEKIGSILNHLNPRGWSIFIFVTGLLITNVSINVLQGPSRALVGDVVPKSQQVLANSLGSLMLGIAAVITNFIGGFNLSKYTNGKFSSEQIVIISGCILLVLGVIVTLICAKEEHFVGEVQRDNPLKEIYSSAKSMPKAVFRISIVYLFSWMAYFPFMVEATDYFGRDIFGGSPDSSIQELKDKYTEGVNFGMLVIGVSNILVMFYGIIQDSVLKCLGMKFSYALSQIIEAICLIPLFFIKDKWILLLLLAPLGISCTIFNSVPFAVVGMIVDQDKMGTYMGILNSFAVIGQQLTNFILGSGIGSIFTQKAPIIAGGSFFAVIAAIMCYWIIVPTNDKENLEPLLINKEDQ